MKSLVLSLALIGTALPAFATELTVWDWKSGDPAAAPYFAKAKEVFEAAHPGVKVFSLPSVDHPVHGRHIELGVKGRPELVSRADPEMLAGLHGFDARLGPELVRS